MDHFSLGLSKSILLNNRNVLSEKSLQLSYFPHRLVSALLSRFQDIFDLEDSGKFDEELNAYGDILLFHQSVCMAHNVHAFVAK